MFVPDFGSRIQDPGSWIKQAQNTRGGKTFLSYLSQNWKLFQFWKAQKIWSSWHKVWSTQKFVTKLSENMGFVSKIRNPEKLFRDPNQQLCFLGWARAPGDSVWRATGGTRGSAERGRLPPSPQHWHASLTVLHGLPGRDRYKVPPPPQHWHATLTVLHGLPGRDRYQGTN